MPAGVTSGQMVISPVYHFVGDQPVTNYPSHLSPFPSSMSAEFSHPTPSHSHLHRKGS